MLAILLYLFENYMNGTVECNADEDTIVTELEQAGFNRKEIALAFDWFEGLNRLQENGEFRAPTPHLLRHYAPQESERLGVKGKGFILYLEQLGILDPMTREIVIDRLMALDPQEADFGHIKWVVLIALFNQPNKKTAVSFLQTMVFSEPFDVLH